MDFGEQFGIEGDVGRRGRVGHDLGQTAVEVAEERHQIETEVAGEIRLEIAVDATVEFAGTAEVAVAEMIECHRGLNEPLVELPRFPAILGPEFLPDLVALEVIAGVEMADPLEIERIVGRFGGHGRFTPAAVSGGMTGGRSGRQSGTT